MSDFPGNGFGEVGLGVWVPFMGDDTDMDLLWDGDANIRGELKGVPRFGPGGVRGRESLCPVDTVLRLVGRNPPVRGASSDIATACQRLQS